MNISRNPKNFWNHFTNAKRFFGDVVSNLKKSIRGDENFYSLFDDKKKFVGFAIVSPRNGLPVLEYIATNKKKGYGRILIEKIINDSKKRGNRQLSLSSVRTAVPFYTKFGFEIAGNTRSGGKNMTLNLNKKVYKVGNKIRFQNPMTEMWENGEIKNVTNNKYTVAPYLWNGNMQTNQVSTNLVHVFKHEVS